MISADASSYGLGAVLLQKHGEEWKPVAFVSRALTETEQRYAQIEKEALAVTWACERFEDYLLGIPFLIETDHKPLVPLLGIKTLDDLPPRILRFRLRLMRYNYVIMHSPGRSLFTADALSRAPASQPSTTDKELQDTTDAFVNIVMQNLPISEKRLEEIRQHQTRDPICTQVKAYCKDGWPTKNTIKGHVKQYWWVSGELTIQGDLLMRGSRLVIPATMRADILHKLHEGHLGVTKCRERARQSVWWPGMSKQLEDLILSCSVCCKERTQRAEPLIPTPFPDFPWQRVGTDLFEWKGSPYLLVVDYYSRYIEVAKLSATTADSVITHMKSIFARHGIPETVGSDSGP